MTPLDKQTLFLLYDAPDNTAKVQVVVRDETIWMTQKAMSELFDTGINNINVHLKNIFDSSELDKTSTIEEKSICLLGLLSIPSPYLLPLGLK